MRLVLSGPHLHRCPPACAASCAHVAPAGRQPAACLASCGRVCSSRRARCIPHLVCSTIHALGKAVVTRPLRCHGALAAQHDQPRTRLPPVTSALVARYRPRSSLWNVYAALLAACTHAPRLIESIKCRAVCPQRQRMPLCLWWHRPRDRETGTQGQPGHDSADTGVDAVSCSSRWAGSAPMLVLPTPASTSLRASIAPGPGCVC